jgi:hypothetical protein
LQTSQGYIIRISQHFATKLWNITNFVMLFQAVMKFLSRLVEFKILVNGGMVHCGIAFLTVFIPTHYGRFPFSGLTAQTRIIFSVSMERSGLCFSNM